MKSKKILSQEVECGFSSYIKACLSRSAFRFFSKQAKDNTSTQPLHENFESSLINNDYAFSIDIVVRQLWLLQALETLSITERQLIYLKYFQEKTDQQIAFLLGVSRQAVTKSKTNVLDKLKRNMDL
ncbi:sigma-70 family RNA polymerase sigma factor [Paenibacillus tritici]|uniref:sigma-70 family RNA polymerase sigma factor n=1 Tax=Paenibacillus tritici TaxID=1873425 RepID=UPI001BA8D4A7|nr:sigma-70 family RNA polymerase sigma factor [Paenibacillus tritici]QUL53515.1 sigma-70 family RNA polymerase sigma factor [Paenibacillus tritici]